MSKRQRRSQSVPDIGFHGPGGHGGPAGPGGHGRFAEVKKAANPGVTIRRLLGYLRNHTRELVLVGLLVIAGTAAQMVMPYIQGWAIDHAITPGNMPLLARAALLLAALALFLGGITFGQQWTMIGVSQRMVRDLRRELYEDAGAVTALLRYASARRSHEPGHK